MHPERTQETQTLLKVRNLTVCIEHPARSFFAVRDVSFNVKAGETFALVGESGSGKTMTALSILDLLPKRARKIGGEITFTEKRVSHHGQFSFEKLRGRHIAMIFQEPVAALNPVIRVGIQIVDVIKTHLDLSTRLAKERTIEILDKVGLPDPDLIYRAYPHQLSIGMAQRVVIAMALSCNPQLIIADEPTSALDVTTQLQILKLIVTLQKQHQFALLLISHDMGVVSTLAGSIAIMYNGRIIESGDTSQLLAYPEHEYTRALIESVLYSPGK